MSSEPRPKPLEAPFLGDLWAEDGDFLSEIIDTQNDIAAVELDQRTIMQLVAERTQKLTEADGASIRLLESNQLVCRAASGIMASQFGTQASPQASFEGFAIKSGRFQYCQDVANDEWAQALAADCAGCGSVAAVPMFHGIQPMGALIVSSIKPFAFQKRRIAALRLMAGVVTAALAHAAELEVKKKLLVERTSALAALRESEERFRSSFQHAAIGKALVALNGDWMQVNQSMCDLVGYAQADLLVTNFQAITHPDDLDADVENMRRLIAGDFPHYHMTKRYLHKQGHVVWIMLSVSMVRSDDGKPLYFVAQVQDVTDRKRIEDALRTSEQAYRTTFELAGIGMAHTDPRTGRFVRVNRQLCQITGYSSDELLCSTFDRMSHPEYAVPNLGVLPGVADGELAHRSIQARLIRKDGRTIWVTIDATMVRGIDGQPQYAVAMVQDVTERKCAEDAVRSSERQFRTLTSHAPVGIFQCDVEGNNQFVNERWCAMTGMGAEVAKGAGWLDAIHPEDRERVVVEWQQAVKAGREFLGDYRYLSPRRRVTWVHGTAVPLQDDAGNVVGFLGTATDVTERKRVEWLERDRREVLELVAQNHPLHGVVNKLLQLVERQIGDGSVAMFLVQDGAINLHAASLPPEMEKALRSRLLMISSILAAGASDGCVEVIVTEMGADCIPAELRQAAEIAHVWACWAVAIHSNDGAPLGILTVFSQRRYRPTDSETSVLMMVSKLATISIEHHNAAQQLSHLVRHDPLTRLPNRILCEDRLQQALASARRSGKSVSIMAIDIDSFKSINDTLGHQAGDHLLQQFAQRLRRILRQTDTLARIGGDEFLVIAPELGSGDDAALIARKLLDALIDPINVGDRAVVATISIGIAVYPRDGESAAALQKKADEALYRVKEQGRNGFSF